MCFFLHMSLKTNLFTLDRNLLGTPECTLCFFVNVHYALFYIKLIIKYRLL